jgi:hypothetical protein
MAEKQSILTVHQSKGIPPNRSWDRVQKLALNIVHAVEFSRNGRTRVSASRPALRATYLMYHFCRGLRRKGLGRRPDEGPGDTTRTLVP